MALAVVHAERIDREIPRVAAMASTVAESSPPDSNTTAGLRYSFARDIAPQNLVELQLKAHRQPVGEDPFGEDPWAGLRYSSARTGSGSARTARAPQERLAPLVVLARTDHEFQLVARREQAKFSSRLRATSPDPGVLTSTTRATRESTPAISIAPLVSSDTSIARVAQAGQQ